MWLMDYWCIDLELYGNTETGRYSLIIECRGSIVEALPQSDTNSLTREVPGTCIATNPYIERELVDAILVEDRRSNPRS